MFTRKPIFSLTIQLTNFYIFRCDVTPNAAVCVLVCWVWVCLNHFTLVYSSVHSSGRVKLEKYSLISEIACVQFEWQINRYTRNQSTWSCAFMFAQAYVHLLPAHTAQTRHSGPQPLIIIFRMRPKIKFAQKWHFCFYFNATESGNKRTECKILRVATSCSLPMLRCNCCCFCFGSHGMPHRSGAVCCVCESVFTWTC